MAYTKEAKVEPALLEVAMPYGGILNVDAWVTLLEGHSTAEWEEIKIITDPDPKAVIPANFIIQRDQHFRLRFWIERTGLFVKYLKGGKWKMDVFFEKMGEPETAIHPQTFVADDGVEGYLMNAGKNYTDLIVDPNEMEEGVYRVVCRLQYYRDGQPEAIAGFHEGFMVQIYED